MTLAEFQHTLAKPRPPAALAPALAALWWMAKDEWDKAHKLVMDETGKNCAWVHAHLHRVEGDLGNAGYWYRQAGKSVASGALKAEWAEIVQAILAEGEAR